jgi:hypothetical protein
MSLNPESAELLQKSYADRLQVSYKLQKNNFLLPVSDNRNLDFLKDNDKDRIDTLWRLFEAALNYRNDEYFVECMNEVLSFASGKIVTISIVLYMIPLKKRKTKTNKERSKETLFRIANMV